MITKINLFTLESRTGEKFRFCDSSNEKLEPFILFGGVKYDFLACKYSDKGGSTVSDRTGEFSVLNIRTKDVNMGNIVIENGSFLGWRLEAKTVDSMHLDRENFIDASEIIPDSAQGTIQLWIVKRRVNMNSRQIDFELGGPLGDLSMPCGTKIYTDSCPYVYRSPECGYTGPPVADNLDNPTNEPSKDSCGKRIKSCGMRFKDQPLHILAFPASSTQREFL